MCQFAAGMNQNMHIAVHLQLLCFRTSMCIQLPRESGLFVFVFVSLLDNQVGFISDVRGGTHNCTPFTKATS